MKYPKGYLIAIGGAEDKGEKKPEDEQHKKDLDFLHEGILKDVVDQLKGREPMVEVITTATSSPEQSFANYKKAFSKLGCSRVGHLNICDRLAADDPKVVERIKKCSGVLFSGGDQLRLCSVLGGTLLLEAIKERYENDAFVIAGTSAGAAAMSGTMLCGGDTAKAYIKGELDLSIGLGFLKNAIIDTHFDERGRFARLAQAIAAQPGAIGIGLGEDTGIIVEKGTQLKVVGSSSVTIIDGSRVQHTNIAEIKKGMPIAIAELVVHLLTHSDQYDLQARKVIPGKFTQHEA